MRSVSAATAPGAPGGAQQLQTLGARRVKTDLHVAEPTGARSCSPAPSLRSQRAKQYRCTFKTLFSIALISQLGAKFQICVICSQFKIMTASPYFK